MKEHKLEISIISVLDIVLTILFILCLNKIQEIILQTENVIEINIYQKIIVTISFIISVSVLDMTALGIIILCKKGFAPIVLITVVAIVLFLAFYFKFSNI